MKVPFLRSLRGRIFAVLMVAILVDVLALSLGGAAATDVAPCDQTAGPAGCVDVTLAPAGLTGDIYVGDTLVSPGVAGGRVSVKPYSYLKITAKNFKDGNAENGDAYQYLDASTYVYLFPGQTQAITLTPYKHYIKGFIAISCSAAIQPGESLACRPSINGVLQADVAPGATWTYPLLPGVYTIHIDLVGDSATHWSPGSLDNSVTIVAGQTVTVAPPYAKANLVTLTLDQPGTYGDFYANGQQLTTQTPTAQVWLPANQTSVVEVRNVTDPAAFEFHWADNKTSLPLTSGLVQTVQLALVKTWDIGWVDVGCDLEDLHPDDDVICTAIYDGQPKIPVAPGARGKWTAAAGFHTVTMILEGKSATRWNFAKVEPITVVNGQVNTLTFKFTLAPPAAPRTSVLSGVTPDLEKVYLAGLAMGNNPHSFSKIGDCETFNPEFLQPVDQGQYGLGNYNYVGDVIPYFSGSFSHVGVAAVNGLELHSILDPFWADKNVCTTDESPLACEYRLHKPSVALIMARTSSYGNGPGSQFDQDLRKLVQVSLDHGVIPVLSTLAWQAGAHPSPEEMNATIRQVAADTHVPLWDFWVTTESLPNRGVDDTFHLTEPSPAYLATYFTGTNLNFGMTRRNLEALQVLHELLDQVLLPASQAPPQ